ncbi:MAG: peptide ABC transporter substrate-binding protein [Chloroflexota bacterium]
MKKLRWQILIAVIAVGAVALLLFGQTVAPEITDVQPTTGGVYVEGLVGTPIRFNPLLDSYNQVDRDVDNLIYSRLIRFDSWGNPQPDLVKSFGVSITGEIYNIQLRENAVWHDGTPVTTADILFTIGLMAGGEMPVPSDVVELWNSVDVIAFDALNMQFRLPEPYAPFIDYLSFGVLPYHLLGSKSAAEIINDPFNLQPVGTGPYQLTELRTKDGQITGIVLEAFEDYFLDQPLLEQIAFRYFSTTFEALAAYQRGEILGIGEVGLDAIDAVLAEPGLNIHSVRLPEITMVLFNLDNAEVPFFQELNVRKALMLALNRPWMIDQSIDGQAMLAHSPILAGTWAHYDGVVKYQFDPEEAIRLLRGAEYGLGVDGAVREKEGVRLSFEMVFPDTPTHTRLAMMIRDYWAAVGVGVNLIPVPPTSLVRDYLQTHNYQAALVDLSLSDSPDPDPYPFWHQAMINNGQNYSQWDDRRASEYLENARVTPNRDERVRLYKNFQIHYSRELPALPLFSPVYNYAVDDEISGIQMGPLYDPSDRFNSVVNWSLQAPQLPEEVIVEPVDE